MKIGLRTLKTVIAAVLSMVVASTLHLLYWPSAGIIAILSVGNTKRSSLYTGGTRFFAFLLATGIAYLCFQLLGYTPVTFGLYLLIFIPSAVYFGLSEGIVVNSVLVTHYLVEGHMSLQLIYNEFLLFIIGVGFALLVNLYIPSLGKKLESNQEKIEEMFREILQQMAATLLENSQTGTLESSCESLKLYIRESQIKAREYKENYWLREEIYYENYFSMRRAQINILQDMLRNLERIDKIEHYSGHIYEMLIYTANTFSKENDGQDLMGKIEQTYQEYRKMPLPSTRHEFEARAELFQFLQSFKSFIEIKLEFAQTKK
ncbi:MAG: aromatic acid exporter family protein [Enterococcus sp.]